MADIYEFPNYEMRTGESKTVTSESESDTDSETTTTGDARCLLCKHRWTAVAPTKTKTLQCPNCSLFTGMFNNLCAPGVGEMVLTCDCGGENFWVLPDRFMCYKCGDSLYP